MPLTFPAHQGLILPAARRWPGHFAALALSVGAAMPDITDSTLGLLINGYFKHWYGHALIGIFTLNLPAGLFITWLITVFVSGLLKYVDLPQRWKMIFTKAPPDSDTASGRIIGHSRGTKLSLWSFSVLIGIISHLFFDLFSHDTNVLLYPWYDNVQWFPEWWYTTWFEIPALTMFGRSYSVGFFTVIWCILTLVGILLFFRYLNQNYNNKI